ncbi:MAG: MCE family protein [Deltaproteobacteria bacterium]|nr:MCE family protein [Deltaproteobacteria bacterium]
MEPEFTDKEKAAGAFIVLVCIILIALVAVIGKGKHWFKRSVIYYTTFNEGYNLKVGAPVKYLKAEIGKVEEITPVENQVKVTLAVLEDFVPRIRQDVTVTVESPTLIGSEYVSIQPGTPDAPVLPEGSLLPSKEKKSVSDILEEFQVEKTAKQFIRAVRDLSGAAELLRDPKGPLFSSLENLNRTTGHLERIVADLDAGKGTVGRLLRSDALYDAMTANMETLGETLENIRRASEAAPDAMARLEDNLSTLKRVQQELFERIQSVRSLMDAVQDNLKQMKTILSNLEEGSRDIPEITRTAKEGIREIREGVERMDRVIHSIQENVLIRSNLPPPVEGKNLDADLRQ